MYTYTRENKEMRTYTNDYEKALDYLQFFVDCGNTNAASQLLREKHGAIHENVAEWVEYITRNNPEFWEVK